MGIPKNEIVDLGEYKVVIEYDGKGGLDVTVLDEADGEIEGLYISDLNVDDIDSDENNFDINLN
jgi:hypothetical protein